MIASRLTSLLRCLRFSRIRRRRNCRVIYYQYIDSPVDPLLLAASDDGLHLIEFHSPRHPMARLAGMARRRPCDCCAMTR